MKAHAIPPTVALAKALEQNDSATVETLLTADITLLDPSTGLMSLAAKMANIDTMQVILTCLAKNKLLPKNFFAQDPLGRNTFHLVAQYNSAAVLQLIISAIDFSDASRLARSLDNDKKFPIHLTKLNKDSSLRKQNYALLEPLTAHNPFIPLNQEINQEKILATYLDAKSSDNLKNNLITATQAVNLTRKKLHQSDTHPEINTKSTNEIQKLHRTIDRQRSKLREEVKDKSPSSTLTVMSRLIEEGEAESCEGYSFLTLANVRKSDADSHSAVLSVRSGDHVFCVVGISPDCKSTEDYENPAKWGSDAVIADAWSGEVYPASLIYSKLGTHFMLQLESRGLTHVIGDLNPDCHGFRLRFIMPRGKSEPEVKEKKVEEVVVNSFEKTILQEENSSKLCVIL
jgi:hypothetical protein